MSNSTESNTPQKLAEPAAKGSPKAKEMTRAAVRLAAPFFVWIGIMVLNKLMHLTPSSETKDIPSLNVLSDAALYAIQTVATLLSIVILRPWKFFSPLLRKNILPAVLIGTFVCFLWVFFETDLFAHLCPGLAELYERYCVMGFGELRDPEEAAKRLALFHPSHTGWPLWIVHMIGTGIAVAIAEEFFWRGYLLRAARTPDFLDVDIGQFHAISFLAVSAIFAFEHAEWAVGFITALLYGAFYLRTRDIWAVSIAHCTTNLLLGFYVLHSGHWEFW